MFGLAQVLMLLSLAMYTYIGTAMPPYLYDMLIQHIKELIKDINQKTLPKWIEISEKAIPEIMAYLNDWADFKISVKTLLEKTGGKSGHDEIFQKSLGMPEYNAPQSTYSHMKGLMEKISDEDLLDLPVPGDTLEEKRKNMHIAFEKMDLDDISSTMTGAPELRAERAASKETNIVFPPKALMSRHPELNDLLRGELMLDVLVEARVQGRQKKMKEHRRRAKKKKTGKRPQQRTKTKEVEEEIDGDESDEELDETAKRILQGARSGQFKQPALDHVMKTFKPNPTFWDRWWVEVMGISNYRFEHSPFDAAQSVCETMEYPEGYMRTRCYDFLAPFFAGAAHGIAKFTGGESANLKLEWILGDVYKTCQEVLETKEERKSNGFAVEYDRIFLSNIPDYTGGHIPIATFCTPLLKTVPHALIIYNILLNTGVFKSYEDCVRTYTLLDIKQQEKFLAMKHVGGELWGDDPRWVTLPCPLPTSQLATQEELSGWLHRLFLLIVLPPLRQGSNPFRIDHPINLLGFVNLIGRLAEIGYPHHWLANVLDSLMSGKIKTRARPPPDSNVLYLTQATISTLPFIAELEYALAVAQSRLPFRLLTPLPSTFRTVTYNADSMPVYDQKSAVIAIYLAPPKAANPYSLKGLREKIVGGNPDVSLISITNWNSVTQTLQFTIETSRFEKMVKNDWQILLVRLDNYESTVFMPTSVRKLK